MCGTNKWKDSVSYSYVPIALVLVTSSVECSLIENLGGFFFLLSFDT